MTTLPVFLLARLDEDEAVATAAMADPVATWTDQDWVELDDTALAHVARHDPGRVLRRCEADRRIVELYLAERSRRDIYQSEESRAVEDDEQRERRRSSAARCRGLEMAVEALALPYADHPDYRAEWKP